MNTHASLPQGSTFTAGSGESETLCLVGPKFDVVELWRRSAGNWRRSGEYWRDMARAYLGDSDLRGVVFALHRAAECQDWADQDALKADNFQQQRRTQL